MSFDVAMWRTRKVRGSLILQQRYLTSTTWRERIYTRRPQRRRTLLFPAVENDYGAHGRGWRDSYYVQGRHDETVPNLYVKLLEKADKMYR
jgi:hypothetical protein